MSALATLNHQLNCSRGCPREYGRMSCRYRDLLGSEDWTDYLSNVGLAGARVVQSVDALTAYVAGSDDPEGAITINESAVVRRTDDGGKTWRTVLRVFTDGLSNQFNGLTIRKGSRGMDIWAVGWRGPTDPTAIPIVYHSTDGGVTWSDNLGANLPGTAIQIISVEAITAQDVLVGGVAFGGTDTNINLYRTNDGGVSWTQGTGGGSPVAPGTNVRYINDILFINSTNIWVVGFTQDTTTGSSTKYMAKGSLGAGQVTNWTEITVASALPGGDLTLTGYLTSIQSITLDRLYVSGNNGFLGATAQIWVTNNGGAAANSSSWTPQTLPTLPGSTSTQGTIASSIIAKDSQYLWATVTNFNDATNPTHVTILSSQNGGATWNIVFTEAYTNPAGTIQIGFTVGTPAIDLSQMRSCCIDNTVIWIVSPCTQQVPTSAACETYNILKRQISRINCQYVAPPQRW